MTADDPYTAKHTPRRPRGTLGATRVTTIKPQIEVLRRADALAKRMGVSRTELIELLVKHVELDDAGYPEWFPTERREDPAALPLQEAS